MRRANHQIEADIKQVDERGRHLATGRRVLVYADELHALLTHEGVALDDPDLATAFRALTEQIQAELSSR